LRYTVYRTLFGSTVTRCYYALRVTLHCWFTGRVTLPTRSLPVVRWFVTRYVDLPVPPGLRLGLRTLRLVTFYAVTRGYAHFRYVTVGYAHLLVTFTFGCGLLRTLHHRITRSRSGWFHRGLRSCAWFWFPCYWLHARLQFARTHARSGCWFALLPVARLRARALRARYVCGLRLPVCLPRGSRTARSLRALWFNAFWFTRTRSYVGGYVPRARLRVAVAFVWFTARAFGTPRLRSDHVRGFVTVCRLVTRRLHCTFNAGFCRLTFTVCGCGLLRLYVWLRLLRLDAPTRPHAHALRGFRAVWFGYVVRGFGLVPLRVRLRSCYWWFGLRVCALPLRLRLRYAVWFCGSHSVG